MTVALIADVHLGNHHRSHKIGGEMVAGINARAREVAECISRACQLRDVAHAKVRVVAGDLFDEENPTPELVTLAMQSFSLGWDFLVGNHDQSSDLPGHHALGPLHDTAGRVIERPNINFTEDYTVISLPFRNVPGEQLVREGLEYLHAKDLVDGPKLLVVHLGIEDKTTPPWMQGHTDSIHIDTLLKLMSQYRIEACAAGNWHRQSVYHAKIKNLEHNVVQIGALAPTGWDNPGLEGYGSVVLWEPGKPFRTIEVPGPRFLADQDPPEPRDGYRYYQKHTVRTVEQAKMYVGKDVTVEFDKKAARSLHVKAAAAARSQGTIVEALEAYCGEKFAERSQEVSQLAASFLTKVTI